MLAKKPKLAIIAQPEYFGFMYGDALRDHFDLLVQPFNFSGDEGQFETLLDFNADVNVFFRGEFVPPRVIDKLKGITVAWSSEPFPKFINGELNGTVDSITRFETFLAIKERSFDYILHYDPISKSFLESQGVSLSGFEPFPVACDRYKPGDRQYDWDCFFVGRHTQHRIEYFQQVPKTCTFLNVVHGVHGYQLQDYISRSLINLNLHAENEVSLGSRLQLLMACGALIISEPIPHQGLKPLQPGEHYIEIGCAEDLHDQIENILSRPNQYECFRHAARQFAETTISDVHVFTRVVESVTNAALPKPSFSKNVSDLDHMRSLVKYGLEASFVA